MNYIRRSDDMSGRVYKERFIGKSICIFVFFIIIIPIIPKGLISLSEENFFNFNILMLVFGLASVFLSTIYYLTSGRKNESLLIILYYLITCGGTLASLKNLQFDASTYIPKDFIYVGDFTQLFSIVLCILMLYLYNFREKIIEDRFFPYIFTIAFLFGIGLGLINNKLFDFYIQYSNNTAKLIISVLNVLFILVMLVLSLYKWIKGGDLLTKYFFIVMELNLIKQIYLISSLSVNDSIIFIGLFLKVATRFLPIIVFGYWVLENAKLQKKSYLVYNNTKDYFIKFYGLVESSNSYIMILDKEKKVDYINAKFEEFININYLDKKQNEVLADLVGKTGIINMLNKPLHYVDDNNYWSGELVLESMEGKKIYLSVKISKIMVASNHHLGYSLTLDDNSKNIELNNILIEKDNLFNILIENITEMVCTLDLEGRINYCSPSYIKTFGGEFESYKMVPWVHNVVDEDIENVLKDIKEIIENNVTLISQCRMTTKNEEIMYVEYIITPVYSECGYVTELVISARDISKRKRVETQVNNIEEKFVNIFNVSPDLILLIDVEEFKVLDVNPAFCDFVKFKKDKIVGENICEILKELKWKGNKGIIEDIKDRKVIKGQEVSFTINGKVKYLEVNYSAIFENGVYENILCFGRDITEKKEVEKLEKELDSKVKKLDETLLSDQFRTDFIANVSHELRTPINVIFSSLQVLELYKNNKEVLDIFYNKYIYVIKQNCYRLLRLINNLIDITKIDSGYMKLNVGSYDIVKIIEDITMSVVIYGENKGITIIFDTSEEEIITNCDPDSIERIMLNLLSNAIKFTNSGGKIKVFVDLEENIIKIVVRDTGEGIPKNKLNAVFERFKQAGRDVIRENEGSGIGLSLVKSLVELHGGNVTVSSTEGVGSEFIIKIPVSNNTLGEVSNITKDREQTNIQRISIEFSDIYQ